MPEARGPSELNLVQLLPNLMTIAAMCSGLTGIRFATTGQFGAAVAMILVAASMSLALRSFILTCAISRTCAIVTLPTVS